MIYVTKLNVKHQDRSQQLNSLPMLPRCSFLPLSNGLRLRVY